MADIEKQERLEREEDQDEHVSSSLEPVQLIIDELSAVCNSLGKLDENDGTYMKDRDCKPCLREIQRYLNADSKHHTARCTLGAYNIIKCDLIPLMVQYCDYNDGDPELFNTVVRLSSNLTSSIVLLFNNQHEIDDKVGLKKLENKLLNSLYNYKVAFAENDQIWTTLNTHLRHNRDDELIFERLIILIRNILHIPVDSTADMGVHTEFDAHDMCLYRMDKSGLLETIIQLTSDSQKGPEFCFHLTEIIYLMLRDQNPETLAKTKPNILKKKLEDEDVDKRRLAELSARNRRERQDRTRYSNQLRLRGSSFVVQNIRSIGERDLVLNKPLVSHREDINFDKGKTQIRKAKNKKPLSSETSMQISDTNTKASKNSYTLKVFCQQFLKKIYNDYMHQIKHNLIQRKSQENDETYYLWAVQFFTAFCRHSKMSIDLIAETLSTSTLHYIQVLITSYQEKIKLEKKDFADMSKRMHLAIRAYREIMILIKDNSNDTQFSDKISSIKKFFFNDNDYVNLLLNLFQQYDEPKHSAHYMEDLIQTNHIFLEVLNNHTAEETIKSSFLYKYCCPDVIKCHANALKNFKINRGPTNIAILRLFEKIVETGNDVVLFQASLFRTLLNVIEYEESFKLLTVKLISKFGKMANKKRWMYQELLFWKTGNDVIEIENAIDPPPAPKIVPEAEAANEDILSTLFGETGDEIAPNSPQLEASNSQKEPQQQVHDSLDELRAELWDSEDEDLEKQLDLSDSDSVRIPAQKRKVAVLESSDEEEDELVGQQQIAAAPPSSSLSSSPLSELPDAEDDLDELKDLLKDSQQSDIPSDYDSSKLVDGQLEAVGAVLSVVPVTSILATAGLVGVKLAALSRLLHVLGYDQAYLANGGSGTAAQPIGLQTNYAYMFPYVPGLNISVKGEHGSQYQNQAAHQKESYSTTRKTYPAMGLPGDYENQNSPFRGAETLREIFKDSGIEFRYPTTQQQQQQIFNQPKGNGQINHASLPPNNLMNNNLQQTATTPTHHHETHHPSSSIANNNHRPDLNNNHHFSPPPSTLPQPNMYDTDAMNPTSFGQPHQTTTTPQSSQPHHPVNVIGHDTQANNNRPPSTSNSLGHGQPDQLAGPHLPPSLPQPPSPESSSEANPSPVSHQSVPGHRVQRPQVNMPHPHNVQPAHNHHPTPLPVQPAVLMSPPVVATFSASLPPPFQPSSPPELNPNNPGLHENNVLVGSLSGTPDSPLLSGPLTSGPQEKPKMFHPIPQHDYFNRLQSKHTALPTGQVVKVPSGAPNNSKPPQTFEDYARFTFDPITATQANPATAPTSMPAVPTGFTGSPTSEVTTNIVSSTFSTDQPPPFHDDLENNEINLGAKRRRRRRKRDLNCIKQGCEEPSALSDLMKPSWSSPQLNHNNHNQQQHQQRDRKNENFGMPALNIHPTFRRKRSSLGRILLGTLGKQGAQ